MAKPRACYSLHWNPFPTGKDELAGAALTKGSGTPTSIPVVSCAPIPALTAAFAPLLASATADLAARYLAKDLQKILKTILEARALAPQPEGFRKRPLKARAPDLYCGKTHMECYNFCRRCEDYFAIADATRLNCIPFATTFLKDQALFRWQ